MNPLSSVIRGKPYGLNPLAAARRIFAGFLVLAAFAGHATGADITATPPVGGGFVVTNADKTSERLRVNEDGTVSIVGPVVIENLKNYDINNPVGNILVCLNTTTGRLSRCAPPPYYGQLGTGPIYIKQGIFDVMVENPEQTYVTECDDQTDKVIAGDAYLRWESGPDVSSWIKKREINGASFFRNGQRGLVG